MRTIPALLGLVLMAGCHSPSGDNAAAGGANTPPGAGASAAFPKACDRVDISEWGNDPLPAAADIPVSAEVQAARDAILGPDATNPDEVKFWWFGVSSFVASAGGHLFLFDAWEPVGAQEDYVPVGREEIAAIRPEAIFIGHGHFDHAADAGYIAARSGAVVVGSETICSQAKADADGDPETSANDFCCMVTGTDTTPAPGTTTPVKFWADLPEIQVLQHLHSAADPDDPGEPFIHIPNLLPYLQNLNTDPEEIAAFVASQEDEQGGTWAYHIRSGEFSMLWHDSTGPINSGQPFGDDIQTALNSFPDCVDVQLHAIVGFNQPFSGLRDPRLYVGAAHPKIAIPTHHDAWAPVIGGGAESYEAEWRAEVASLPNPPEIDYLFDPQDYMVPRVYDINDPRWAAPMPGSSCAGP